MSIAAYSIADLLSSTEARSSSALRTEPYDIHFCPSHERLAAPEGESERAGAWTLGVRHPESASGRPRRPRPFARSSHSRATRSITPSARTSSTFSQRMAKPGNRGTTKGRLPFVGIQHGPGVRWLTLRCRQSEHSDTLYRFPAATSAGFPRSGAVSRRAPDHLRARARLARLARRVAPGPCAAATLVMERATIPRVVEFGWAQAD